MGIAWIPHAPQPFKDLQANLGTPAAWPGIVLLVLRASTQETPS